MEWNINNWPIWLRVFLYSIRSILKGEYSQIEERFWRWLAYRVSKHLVYYTALRLMCNEGGGRDKCREVPDISTREAMMKWCQSRVEEGYYK